MATIWTTAQVFRATGGFEHRISTAKVRSVGEFASDIENDWAIIVEQRSDVYHWAAVPYFGGL